MSVVIKMKGLPFEATAKDIQSFFEGLHLREDDIHLAAYKDGKAAGIAFAIFNSDDDARKAMFRNHKYMGKRYIELFLSSSSEMKFMLDIGVPEPKHQRGSERTEHQPFPSDSHNRQNRGRGSLRNDDDFQRRQRSRSPMKRQRYSEERGKNFRGRGRNSGNGLAREIFDDRKRRSFESNTRQSGSGLRWRGGQNEDDTLEMSHKLRNEMANAFEGEGMGNRKTRLDREDNVRGIRGSFGAGGSGKKDLSNRYNRSSSRTEENRSRDRENVMAKTCCKLDGLPFQISESEIVNFFNELLVIKVKLLYHPTGSFAGRKNGEGYVEFKSAHDASEAAKKDHQYLGSRYVEVQTCSKLEMVKEARSNEEACRRASAHQESRYHNLTTNAVSDLAIRIDPELLSPSMHLSDLLDRGRDLGITMPSALLPTEELEHRSSSTLNQRASTANINPDDVAAGSVVGIRNLPSTISAEEILDFFYGFPVYQDSVRIHYLAPGQSSGDAMITFQSGLEATIAIEQLNHKPVGKCNVQLFLV